MARLNPTNFGYQNFYSGLLTADITSGSLTISLDTVPTPTSGILVIEPDSTTNREVILYTSKGASTITLPSDGRGFDGSTAVAHLAGTTIIMAPVGRMFSALASGETSTDPLRTETFFDHINAGAIWTADAAGSTLLASMSSGVAYILGRRLTIAAVANRAFTASKDTYIDLTDNLDGTALITYSEVSNNAASPALATNALRLGIVVTGATNIAAAASINQGQENKVLPIASSIPYTVTDSIGNLICPRDPSRRVIGYRQIIANATSTTSLGSGTDIAGLNLTCIIPTGRKVKVSGFIGQPSNSVANNAVIMELFDVTASTLIATSTGSTNASGDTTSVTPYVVSSAGGTRNYKARLARGSNAATASTNSTAANPSYLLVELW